MKGTIERIGVGSKAQSHLSLGAMRGYLKNEAAATAIHRRKAERVGVVDLNHLPAEPEIYECFKAAFAGYEISVMAFTGSSLLYQARLLSEAGLSIKLLTEQPVESSISNA